MIHISPNFKRIITHQSCHVHDPHSNIEECSGVRRVGELLTWLYFIFILPRSHVHIYPSTVIKIQHISHCYRMNSYTSSFSILFWGTSNTKISARNIWHNRLFVVFIGLAYGLINSFGQLKGRDYFYFTHYRGIVWEGLAVTITVSRL